MVIRIVDYRRDWVGKRDKCLELVPKDYPVKIDKVFRINHHFSYNGFSSKSLK